MNTVTVGISDLNIVKAPDVLVTYALGSCVGICLYDPVAKIAGLSHIMLPSVSQMPGARDSYKFADTAIVILVKKMTELGARSARMKAKIAGGAQMFAALSNSSIANIGQRNVTAVKNTLAQLNIPIIAEDTGKNYGRTLYFNADTGLMQIKSGIHGEWVW
ncbi:chemotaxis protein CheD [Marasmitruncus massiliensis]|jgi:chemotaxis protein CheD|uniref:chemotaxis protein CheD n=1 Tax=Marasmitruncus massiliensis TaxID=1944642 RepID=UPI000C7AAE76|nr:chemotaxis protein CheD [Marasmitruncus massiliensis]MBE6906550.1 chemotaxis protein CheD [Oscillospiraceae bacterium]